MSQHYSDPSRANDPHALPNIEVFESRYAYCPECDALLLLDDCQAGACHACDDLIVPGTDRGWFHWYCFPGCLPDSDPMGPYETEQAAIAAAREEQD